jgi:hypothetical protein
VVQPVNPIPDPPVRGTIRWVASFPNGTRFTNPASPGVVFVIGRALLLRCCPTGAKARAVRCSRLRLLPTRFLTVST